MSTTTDRPQDKPAGYWRNNRNPLVDELNDAAHDGVDAVRKILDRGVFVDEEHYDGETALFHACTFRLLDVVALLIECGANVNKRKYRSGATPLMRRSANRPRENPIELEMVDLLIKAGAKVNARCYHGLTALHWASHFKYGMRQFLMDHGADPQIKDNLGLTAADHLKVYEKAFDASLEDWCKVDRLFSDTWIRIVPEGEEVS